MTVRSLYPVLSTLAVVTVGTLGFIEGPLVALGVVGALIVVAAALMLVQRRDGGPPPRAVASALPPAAAKREST